MWFRDVDEDERPRVRAACHVFLFPRLGIAGQEHAGCAVAKYVRLEYPSAFLGVLALIVFQLVLGWKVYNLSRAP